MANVISVVEFSYNLSSCIDLQGNTKKSLAKIDFKIFQSSATLPHL